MGGKGVGYLLTARVVKAAHVRSLRADYWESLLEVVKYGECLVELGSNRWHVRAERVFVRAAVVALLENI